MTCTLSAPPEQTAARQQAFDSLPDPTTLVSREEIRAALTQAGFRLVTERA